jgi:8-oxo-dGTP diphosphatase
MTSNSNAYESGEQKNVPAVLIYVFSPDRQANDPSGKRVLMIHRNSKERPNDFHAGKWNGLGGKCEKGESYRQAAARELEEEAGIRVSPEAFRFAGFLQFPDFKPQKHEDWSCMVFTTQVESNIADSVTPSISEGSLHWIETERLLELNLWDGDRHFLPYVIEGRPFTGCTWYIDGKAAKSEIVPIEFS